MVKSFFVSQTEMNQTDTQRLMFSWKKTELENIFGDENIALVQSNQDAPLRPHLRMMRRSPPQKMRRQALA
jgi:hypothetical protein